MKKKLLRKLKKTCSAFIGHWKRVLQISGQKIRLVCYQLYTISYEIVYEIVEKPELFVVRVVFVAVFRFVIVFTRFLLVKTYELTRACLCAVFQVIIRFARFLLVNTYELTRAFLHFLYSTGSVYISRNFVDDRLVVIYRNPFLEIMIAILVTRMIYEIGEKLGRIFASRGIDFDHLDLFILLLFILNCVYVNR